MFWENLPIPKFPCGFLRYYDIKISRTDFWEFRDFSFLRFYVFTFLRFYVFTKFRDFEIPRFEISIFEILRIWEFRDFTRFSETGKWQISERMFIHSGRVDEHFLTQTKTAKHLKNPNKYLSNIFPRNKTLSLK